jgi:hypothetical protein
MINMWTEDGLNSVIERINKLTPNHAPQWGKMNVAQMLAHASVPYSFVYEQEKYKKPNFLVKFLLKSFLKPIVAGPKPYAKNGRTAPEFIISDERVFQTEKEKLLENILKTHKLGEKHFEGLDNFSFGPMTANEWNVLFAKHIDHHLQQFGV